MERKIERQRKIKGHRLKEREETGVINKCRQTVSWTDKLSKRKGGRGEKRQGNKNSAAMYCTVFQSLTHFLLNSQMFVLCRRWG